MSKKYGMKRNGSLTFKPKSSHPMHGDKLSTLAFIIQASKNSLFSIIPSSLCTNKNKNLLNYLLPWSFRACIAKLTGSHRFCPRYMKFTHPFTLF